MAEQIASAADWSCQGYGIVTRQRLGRVQDPRAWRQYGQRMTESSKKLWEPNPLRLVEHMAPSCYER